MALFDAGRGCSHIQIGQNSLEEPFTSGDRAAQESGPLR